MFEELRKSAQPLDLTAVLELTAELSKVRMKRKDDPKVLSSAISKNKGKDAEGSVDESNWWLLCMLQHPRIN